MDRETYCCLHVYPCRENIKLIFLMNNNLLKGKVRALVHKKKVYKKGKHFTSV